MSDNSRISWTDATWNPVVGCSHASPGCAHCYAEKMAARLDSMGQARYAGLTRDRRWTGEVRCVPEVLEQPLHWHRPRRVFVCSMGDLFHELVPDEFIAAVFGVMAACPQHTFQVLTKRPGRARQWCEWIAKQLVSCGGAGVNAARGVKWYAWQHIENLKVFDAGSPWIWPLHNVWLGVTAEDQQRADERIPHLLATPAAVRFVSVEPMLGPIDLRRLTLVAPEPPYGPGAYLDALTGHVAGPDDVLDARIDLVIVGGERGPGARPMHPDWARSVRDQCVGAGVPFFFKQWGEWADRTRPEDGDSPQPLDDSERWLNVAGGHGFHGKSVRRMRRVGKTTAGDLLDGREWRQMPGKSELPPIAARG